MKILPELPLQYLHDDVLDYMKQNGRTKELDDEIIVAQYLAYLDDYAHGCAFPPMWTYRLRLHITRNKFLKNYYQFLDDRKNTILSKNVDYTANKEWAKFKENRLYSEDIMLSSVTEEDCNILADAITSCFTSCDPLVQLNAKFVFLMILYYVREVYSGDKEKCNSHGVLEFLRKPEEYDKIFDNLAHKNPLAPALPYYVTYKKLPQKTKDIILNMIYDTYYIHCVNKYKYE